jgi:hypothetical protein
MGHDTTPDSGTAGATRIKAESIQDPPKIPVGAAEGCDLLLLMSIFKNNIKRSQPAAAPTGGGVSL